MRFRGRGSLLPSEHRLYRNGVHRRYTCEKGRRLRCRRRCYSDWIPWASLPSEGSSQELLRTVVVCIKGCALRRRCGGDVELSVWRREKKVFVKFLFAQLRWTRQRKADIQ